MQRKDSIHILLADDDPHFYFFFKRSMQQEKINHIVTHVSRGSDLLDVLRTDKTPYDCILLDMNMPGSSGQEILQEVRKITTDIPVLVVSHLVWSPVSAEMRQLGALEYLEKPTGLDGYKEFIKKIISSAIPEFRFPQVV